MKKKILVMFLVIVLIITGGIINYSQAVDGTTNDTNIQMFYYSQLTNDISKKIYEGLLKDTNATGVINVQTDISFKVTGLTNDNVDDKLQDAYDQNIRPYVYDAFSAFILDHPEYYWIRYNSIDGTITPNISYNMDKGNVKISEINMELYIWPQSAKRSEFTTKLKDAANSITGENDYEIAKNIHDYICKNVSNKDLEGTEVEQTAYGALMNKKASDEGQSNLFTLLCREKGINALIVRGSILKDNTEKAYQWVNLYNQEEQKWYVVDVNQDNGDTDSSSFFMVGNNTVVDGVKVSDRLVANVKPYEEQNTTFKEPTVTSNSYEKFVVKVEYSTKETTKDTVIVTITANKEMKAIEGWTLSDDKKTLQGEFSKNVNGTVTLESTSGEKIDQQIVITNIDNNPPVLEVSYSTEKIASEVTATIKSDSELQPVEGWTLSADKKSLTKTYTKNTTETIKVYDTTSNFDTVKISINNIINGAPKCEISYSTKEQTRDDVIVTIKSDREIKEVSGWTLSEDKKSLTKTYTKNTKEDIKIEDLAGNKCG